jgi:hypothetical protein
MPETAAKPPASQSFVNALLDHRLIRETVSVSNTAAQTTKTTTHPSGSQTREGK